MKQTQRGNFPILPSTREFTTVTRRSSRTPFDHRYSILELDIGMICACLLAFPAFIDHYGPGLKRRIGSYSILRRSTTRKLSASSKEGSSSGNGGIFKNGSSDEYANLAGGPSGTMLHDITPETADHSYRSNHRAKLEYEDAFQSLQSPQPLASAHIV